MSWSQKSGPTGCKRLEPQGLRQEPQPKCLCWQASKDTEGHELISPPFSLILPLPALGPGLVSCWGLRCEPSAALESTQAIETGHVLMLLLSLYLFVVFICSIIVYACTVCSDSPPPGYFYKQKCKAYFTDSVQSQFEVFQFFFFLFPKQLLI